MRYVERYTLRQMMWSQMGKLWWWPTMHLLRQALGMWVHKMRQMLHLGRICCKIDKSMRALPMWRLLMMVTVCLWRISIRQLKWIVLLTR